MLHVNYGSWDIGVFTADVTATILVCNSAVHLRNALAQDTVVHYERTL